MIQLTNLNINKKYLLAVSGGLDSMVLLHLFNNSEYNFVVAHMNFQLREEDSKSDQLMVEAYCIQNDINFTCKKVNVESYKKNRTISTQMAARDLRYTWFNELIVEYKIDNLVTAHHLDDVLEGFLLNLGRGSSLEGLLNLWNIENPIRPLLAYGKSELHDYAIKHSVKWREDKSNKENTYQRNYLRNEVIPKLKQSKKDYLNRFKQSLTLLEDSYNLNKILVNKFKADNFIPNQPLSISKEALKPYIDSKTFLQLLFSEYGFFNALEIQKLFKGSTGSSIHSKTHTLLNNRKEFLLYPLLDKIEAIKINDVEALKLVMNNYKFTIEKQADTLALETLDLDKIKFPVYLRTRKIGDQFYPANFKGSIKLSKYYKNLKLSLFEKEKTKVLVDNAGQIIWVVGYRFDRRFTVTNSTINYLNIFKL